jgi:2-keto-4-pentenoate hydratase
LEQYGKAIHPGQVVLTGSPLPLYPVKCGDRFEVRCEHLAAVTAVILGKPVGGVEEG